ncbi:jg4423, partial [Pararge aegeria aegeria]
MCNRIDNYNKIGSDTACFLEADINILSTTARKRSKHAEALDHYKEAISIQPQFADAYSNMGNTLRELQDTRAALSCFKKATEINPLLADAHCNLASIHKDLGNISDAIQSYKTALKIKPNFPDAFCNLAHCLQMICNWENYEDRMYLIYLIVEDQVSGGKNLCSVHPHHSVLYPLTNKSRKEIAARHANLYLERVRMFDRTLFQFPKKLSGRLRIGYVSSDFGNHPTSHLMQSIPGMHNRADVEVFCYALNPDDETAFRRKIVRESEHFVDLSLVKCNNEASEIINRDKINILVNMNGYTKGSRNEIFALRPAPIQVMWLGYPGTSGADYMDYFITDEISSPMSASEDFSEKFAYMPYTYFVGDHRQMFPHLKKRFNIKIRGEKNRSENMAVINAAPFIDMDALFRVKKYDDIVSFGILEPIYVSFNDIYIPRSDLEAAIKQRKDQVYINNVLVDNGKYIYQFNKTMGSGEEVYDSIIFTSRHQYGIPENAIVYCNFNQLYKLDPILMTVWVNILKRVPNSVLWLLSFPSAGKPNLQEFVHKCGLPYNRIIFSKIACKEEHVRRGQLVDVCLDTLLCNGHTTALDILWTGTPMVTLPGDTLASRVAASLLNTLNCSELVAKDLLNYEEIAVQLGTDHELVAASLLNTLNCSELVAKDLLNYEEIAVQLGTDHELVAASLLNTLNCSELVAKDLLNYEEIAVQLGTDHE